MATPVYDETAQNWPGAIPGQRDQEWPGAVTLDYPPSADPAPASSPAAEPEAAPADPDSRKPIEMREAAYWTAPGLDNWTGPVGVYPNRQPPWPPNAVRRFRRVLRISVQTESGWAEDCRTIDCESLAAGIQDIPEFVDRPMAGRPADPAAKQHHPRPATPAYRLVDRQPAAHPARRRVGSMGASVHRR